MYAGLWKHCMVILSFISFIVLISAVGGGVLYLIWSQSIVFGDINLWEVLRLTSKLFPPLYLLMELAHPSVSLSLQTTQQQPQKQPKKTKDEGENSRLSYLHGLSFFHKRMVQTTTDRAPWACLGSRMSAPLVSVVFGSFLFFKLHPSPKRWKGQTIPQHLGSASKKTSTFLHRLLVITRVAKPCFM